ncbi:DNA-3-methyladenine glycosylase [Myxococcus stipitatus DSM 14675]|uniref:Putative 3-methyladenine DNA glycosylase n=2 Tax=Myxococcus stipitatus TaxID=83455 RepID=L7UP99_MYXSD|nr:DNA-3-methyladenine glycosylase [Myxococcus stipitatus]AGC48344.1 DNA-3-methyladenine glycosylase [Myxococcus stipitatus DSM 14675]
MRGFGWWTDAPFAGDVWPPRYTHTMTPLPPSFYARPALVVARELLGTLLVVRDAHGVRRVGRIVETEAYIGEHDLACHAAKGLTARTEVMFGPAGRAYVYFIYGMHCCFNVVTDEPGVGAAVLIRALEPVEGLEAEVRTDGPGRLCKALGLNLTHNRMELGTDALHLLAGEAVAEARVEQGPRIGVDYAGEWAQKPFRFWVGDSQHVSRRPAPRARKRP